ncbi:MAG: 16S rRNA (guanine(527)-N(7))-methyltransferase RsmG [Mycobacteriales bacterium]
MTPTLSPAAEVFGEVLPRLEAYAALLAGPGVERGLLGPRETPRLWERHLLNCAGLSELVADGEVVLDLGSGAGLPGVVLALARPDVQVVLVESLQRRATFLSEAVASLGLTNTLVRRARAEELHGKVEVDVVTARAVAPVDRLAGWALPLLRPGGRLLALKGEQAGAELELARPVLARLGAVSSSVVEVGDERLHTAARVVVVEAGQAVTSRPTRSSSGKNPRTAPRKARR